MKKLVFLAVLLGLFFVTDSANANLALWYQMDSADDFTVGDGTNGYAGRLYVDNKITGETYAAMTSHSGIIYYAAERAVYMNGVHPCKITGQEDPATFFTNTTQYSFSLWAKADLGAVAGNGYAFYVKLSDGTRFKFDLSFGSASGFVFSCPGGGSQNTASNIWNPDPQYADRYVDPETWNMYTATWDADNNYIATYVNGILRASYTGPSGNVPAIPAGVTVTEYGFGDGFGYSGPGGWYRDFRIYDRALGADEVWSLANPACMTYPADINGDGLVNIHDLLLLADDWLGASLSDSDINKDGIVNFRDYAIFSDGWKNQIVQPLVISEFMASNKETFFDGDGDRPDWIEIFNTTPYNIELGGWYLTDDDKDLTKWRFPFGITIKAGEYLVVCASGKGEFYYPYICSKGYYHTNFSLDIEGEYLAVVKPDGQVCFEYSENYPPQQPDISYGLAPTIVESKKFIQEGCPVSYIVPTNSSLGTSWTALGFDDSLWTSGSTGIGFDAYGVFDSLIETDIQSQMYLKQTSAYIRVPFEVENTQAMEFLTLRVKYDDGFVAYLNNIEVIRAYVDDDNGEIPPDFNDCAVERMDSEAFEFEDFDITSYTGLLRNGSNLLAIHGLNSDVFNSNFVIAPELVAASGGVDTQRYVYFKEPTPGSTNNEGLANLGPEISDVLHSPIAPRADQDITVTAKIEELVNPVSPASVQLHWRVMFGPESVCPMYDDGAHGDGNAGDGVYGGIIDSNNFNTNDMIRWYIIASDNQGYSSRFPTFTNPLSTAQYFGTIAKDQYLTSNLPILYWYAEDTASVDTSVGTRCSVFYNDEFYDNVFIRIRGGSSAGWAKKNHKIEFNREHYCLIDPNEIRVDEINLGSVYADTSYIRDLLSMEMHRNIGCPSSLCFPLRIHQNGQYHSMAVYIEQVDSKFLKRNGYDDENPLYKTGYVNCVFDDAYDFEVKNGGYEPLMDFVEGLNLPTAERHNYIFDYMNIPQAISYVVANTICQETDHTQKNFYVHYDIEKEQWACFPWDRDLSWGYSWTGSGNLKYQYGIYFAGWGGDTDNLYLKSVFVDPKTKQMYLRRLRSIMDQYLKPPGTAQQDLVLENRLDEYRDYVKAEADFDRSVWGYLNTGYVNYPHVLISESMTHIKQQHLALRRTYLYNQVDLPAAQPANAYISFGVIEYNPASGNQDEEYIQLVNSNSYAVDISGWKLTGAVEFTFEKSTVICSNDSIYVSSDRVAFKNRTTSPTGGQGHFVQGNYSGHLSNWGETIQLLDENNVPVSQGSYPPDPTAAQQYLRITELMYHPADFNSTDGDEFEYIELQNIGSVPLSLSDVCFTDGIEYRFTEQDNITLDAGEYIVIVKNRDAFASKYDINAINVAPGQYVSNLSNAGEKIKLEDSTNSTILDFEYKDSWYAATDGIGFSLTIKNPQDPNLASWGEKESWRPSAAVDGSPGVADNSNILPDGAIVINEVMSNPLSGTYDWIELHNTTNIAINIGGWFLSDNDNGQANITKYEIASETVLEPYGYVVFSQDQNFGNYGDPGCNEPFGLSSNGETVCLYSGWDGQLTGYSQKEEFGPSEYGVSFGRYQKSTGEFNFVAMETSTPGFENSYPKVGPVIINEIMYNPGEDQDLEYIELHNISSSTVSLYNYMVGQPWRISDAVDYQFLPGASIPAGGYIVIAKNCGKFSNLYPTVPSNRIFGPYDGKLSNDGEKINLEMPGDAGNYISIDTANYDEQAPWPVWDLIPAHPNPQGGGASISRLYVDCYSNDPNNWTADQPSPTQVNN